MIKIKKIPKESENKNEKKVHLFNQKILHNNA